ncbi:tyrosine-type recombinase/integrase [Dictyobacter formicarum]|uniref:Integrase n=1 Tax=Dictyobacter formicarum TaxID=2778368 RepID=A0ABQ3VRW2_9CHLR|nr:tyrosine-type recombinase/integrase [Dictyobacter formicarum]GHO88434.1 hypothetical protein KSZ_64400 [Dictyobacter formicarum]
MSWSSLPGENVLVETHTLLDQYKQFLAGKAEGTTEAYLRTVRHFIAWLVQRLGDQGHFQPALLTKPAVEEYLRHLEQDGLSINHRIRVKSTISNFSQFLIEEKGVLQRNPTRGVDLPPAPPVIPSHLSNEQRSILCSLVAQENDYRGTALFALGYWAGCRVSDVSWLQMMHVHIDTRSGYLHVGYKGSKWRDIDLLEEAREPLHNYLQATSNTTRTYVFTSQRSERLTEEGIHYWFRALKARSSKAQFSVIQELTFHDLRRDFAFRARDAGWSLENLAQYLGVIINKGSIATF